MGARWLPSWRRPSSIDDARDAAAAAVAVEGGDADQPTLCDRTSHGAAAGLPGTAVAGVAQGQAGQGVVGQHIKAMQGMLSKNADQLALARDSMGPPLAYVTSGDGFYADGTFVQHGNYPYVGGCGAPLLVDLGRLYYLLDSSSWAITDPNRDNAFNFVMNSYRPFSDDGAMMDSQRGRGISR